MISPLVRFLLTFVAGVWVGFAVEILPWVQANLVKPYISGVAWICGVLINLFGGDAVVTGAVIHSQSNGFAVKIANGCSGLEVVILLGAAVLAFGSIPVRHRMIGFFACSLVIVIINTVRVISLFYLGQYSRTLFDWAHLYVWDVLIILDGIVVYILWIKWSLGSLPTKHAVQ